MAEDPTDVSDAAILAVFARTDESPLRPGEVVEDVPVELDDLRDRIDDLTERGLLARDDDRQSGTAYHLTPDGRAAADVPDEEITTDVEAQATAGDAGATARGHESAASPPPGPGEASAWRPYELPEDEIESFDPPGTPGQTEQRRRALRAAVGYLRERGDATRADFVADVYPEAPGAYDDPADGWWSDVVEPGLERVPVARPARDGDAWRFDESAVPGDSAE